MFKPQVYNDKKLQLLITNSLIHSHDLACDCSDPTFHSTLLILNQLGKEFTDEQKHQLKKCLGTTTENKDTVDHGDDFGKDLENLFAEDGDTDPTG